MSALTAERCEELAFIANAGSMIEIDAARIEIARALRNLAAGIRECERSRDRHVGSSDPEEDLLGIANENLWHVLTGAKHA